MAVSLLIQLFHCQSRQVHIFKQKYKCIFWPADRYPLSQIVCQAGSPGPLFWIASHSQTLHKQGKQTRTISMGVLNTDIQQKKGPDIKLKMFAKPVFPLSFPREPHSCAFTFPSPPPPISLIKVLFQSCVSATTRPATSIYRYWALLQYVDLGTVIQGNTDATATTFHAPGAKCQNHFISARHWQKSVGLLRRVPRYFNPHKVQKKSRLTTDTTWLWHWASDYMCCQKV